MSSDADMERAGEIAEGLTRTQKHWLATIPARHVVSNDVPPDEEWFRKRILCEPFTDNTHETHNGIRNVDVFTPADMEARGLLWRGTVSITGNPFPAKGETVRGWGFTPLGLAVAKILKDKAQ